MSGTSPDAPALPGSASPASPVAASAAVSTLPSNPSVTPVTTPHDPSKTPLVVWLPIVIALAGALGGGVSWLYAQHATHEKEQADAAAAKAKDQADATRAADIENKRLLNTYLLPIQLKLKLSLSIYNQLSSQYLIAGYGILESYVKTAQDKGADKAALEFALITDLVGIDSQIDELLEGYDASHLTPDFKAESDRFLEHAHTYILRFKALPGVIAAGGQLPTWKTFPAGFPSALEEEIAKRQGRPGSAQNKVSFQEPIGVAIQLNPARDFTEIKRSEARGGGMNGEDWCNQAVALVRAEYPGATVTGKPQSEESRRDFMGNTQYTYSCAVQVHISASEIRKPN